MRWLTLLTVWAWSAAAAPLTVLTWNLQWFPSGTALKAAEDTELARIREAAALIRDIAPDVLVVQEVRDFDAAHRLARKAGGLTVAVCSRFRDFGGTVGWQQVAILSRLKSSLAWSEEWEKVEAVDPPRGFAFAWFRAGTNDVAVYGVHLKSNRTQGAGEPDPAANARKRALAVRQVLRHLSETQASLRERFEVVVVAGDFNSSPEQLSGETTLATLEKAGFRHGFEGQPAAERVTWPGRGRYPDATFDYIFVRGVKATAPLIVASPVSDHRPVARTLALP